MTDVTFNDITETMELIPWSEDFDMSTVPDQVLRSEWARRNARKRKGYTGGVYWHKHNPTTNKCRCVKCMTLRKEIAKAEKAAKRQLARERKAAK
jgi:hypothetical protein